MRNPIVWSRGRFLTGQPFEQRAEATLGHATRSLREFAIALDVFDEATAALEEAHQTMQRKFREAEAASTQPGIVWLPENIREHVNYWEERQLLLAKGAVVALSQTREALVDFARLTGLSEAVLAANRFDTRFPDLPALRDSVAHANARARWVADKGWRSVKGGRREKREVDLALTPAERAGGVVNLSDVLSRNGLVQGACLTLRILRDEHPQMGTLQLTDDTVEAAREVIQALVDSLAWDHILERPEPVAEWKS